MNRTVVTAFLVAAGIAVAPAWAQALPGPTQKLAKVSAEGKIEQLDGLVELAALKKADIDAAIREKMKPLVRDWLLDIQQQVIDNMDFMEVIEPLDGSPGFFDTFDPVNPKMIERMTGFAKQLNAAGQLMNVLEYRRLVDAATSMKVRQLAYEYDAAVLKEIYGDGKDPMAATRFQYRTGYRDSIGMFHRLLDRAAPRIDEAVASLNLPREQGEALSPAIAAVKAAQGSAATRTAVKALLGKLTLVQRRALLMKVRDMAPITDPYAFE
jgi:hypothetical protein